MPTFYAKSTAAQLSIADLEKSTTRNPISRQCPESTKAVEIAALEFARASKHGTLREDAIDDKATGSHMRFLGKHRDVPFFMVEAGKHLFDPETTERRNRKAVRVPSLKPTVELVPLKNVQAETDGINRDRKVQKSNQDARKKDSSITINPDPDRQWKPPNKPHALCLTVFLSSASFLPVESGKSTAKNAFYDVKIDVFLNGELANSTMVGSRYRNDFSLMTEQIVRFTGSRTGRLVEKPWIIMPPIQEPDDKNRNCQSKAPIQKGANKRWDAISAALLAEADNLGRKEQGDRRYLGEYLESLSRQPIPAEVESTQSTSGQNFAILDVAITWGRGSKLGPETPYLTRPTPIRLESFKSSGRGPVAIAATVPESSKAIPQPPVSIWPYQITTRSSKATDYFSIDHQGNLKPESEPSTLSNQSSLPKPLLPPNKGTASSTFPPPTPLPKPTEPIPEKPRYSPTKNNSTETPKSTQSHPPAQPPLIPNNHPTLPHPPPSTSSSPLSLPPPSPPPTKWVTLRYTSPLPPRRPSETLPFFSSSPEVPLYQSRQPQSQFQSQDSALASHPPQQLVPELASSTEVPPQPGNLPQNKKTPVPEAVAMAAGETAPSTASAAEAASACRVGHAGAGIVRNVPAVRGGWFRERGVLMGVRILIV